MSFDALFFREYDHETCNCLHFTVDAWRVLFGIDLSFLTQAYAREGDAVLSDFLKSKVFERIPHPVSPCLCLLRGLVADQTHIATFLDGRVLHISEVGVQYLPPEVVFPLYKKVLFYEYRQNH